LRFDDTFAAETESDAKYIKDKNIVKLLARLDPGQVAREAISTVVTKGYVHRDVHWRHVAVLPVWGGTNNGTVVGFRGVLIDLSNVPTLESAGLSCKEAETEMLARLGLQPSL
jgi:hypothetical protein